jgi:predicted glycosyltransferase
MDTSHRLPIRLRIALYSHDAVGLGHVRRNLAIAGALAPLGADILLLTGTPSASILPRPPGVEVLGLPALSKDAAGRYRARHLELATDEVLRLRARVAEAALLELDPDLLIVDKHPRGVGYELDSVLARLRARGGTRVVLGLRDVLDEPQRTVHEWRRDDSTAALDAWYDEVWVYGDPRVHDVGAQLAADGPLPVPVRHTGYLTPQPASRPSPGPEGPLVVGTVGGGSDGLALAAAVAAADLPPGHRAVVVTGPDMPDADRALVEVVAAGRPDVEVHRMVPGMDAVLDRASAVVTMGGYNAVCESMARGLPTLVVPRVSPRREQQVRAHALARLGAVDVLDPDQATAQAIGTWLRGAVHRVPQRPAGLDLRGLDRVQQHARRLLAGAVRRSHRAVS